MADYRPSPSYLVQQITIQRKNFLTVCQYVFPTQTALHILNCVTESISLGMIDY